MAEKSDQPERIYTVPLRRAWLRESRSKRASKAISTVKDFIRRHTKATEIKISRGLNELIFSRGFQKPPAKIKVQTVGEFPMITVKLPGEDMPVKKDEKKAGISGLKERLSGKPAEKSTAEPKKTEKKSEETASEKEPGEKAKKDDKAGKEKKSPKKKK